MMSKTDPHSSAEPDPDVDFDPAGGDGWHQLESFVDQLQELAHSSSDAQEFYRELLDGCVTLLAAEGGAVWRPTPHGQWRVVHRVNTDPTLGGETAAHVGLLNSVGDSGKVSVLQPRSAADLGENPTSSVLALAPVVEVADSMHQLGLHAVVQLQLRAGSSPATQQGWRELLETIAGISTEFHVREQLRTLRTERGLYDQSLELVRRFQRTSKLQDTAFEIANEGRRFVSADRLSVVVKRGSTWHLLAASGVERIEARADVTKRLQQLAAATCDWGEPVEHVDSKTESAHEFPPGLIETVEQHVDESQARRLVAVPVLSTAQNSESARQQSTLAVLVAEEFTSEADLSRQRVLELAELCEPALRQSLQLDRFPMRASLRWADRWESVCSKLGLTKFVAAVVAATLLLAALVLVRIDFEVEAAATLRPKVERDIFATTDGRVSQIMIKHGDQVAAGEVLAMLHDSQLSLDMQRVDGEIATTRKRLEAIAVARTDRQVREETNNEKLPLSAEAEQLEKRLASLLTQQEILARRRESLTLKSPIDGTVLTLDVQNLLQTRPVERGQVLFTVADTSAGWQLSAEVPQDRISQVVAAQQDGTANLPVRFRLAGETDQTYTGTLASISTAAVLDTHTLDQESPTFEAQIVIDNDQQLLARPGMSAQARILCGKRSLGYVWLHDIWETVYRWLVF